MFSWYDVITCEKKTNRQCALSNAFFLQFAYFLMFLNIQIDLITLKTYHQQFTLATKNQCISSLRATKLTSPGQVLRVRVIRGSTLVCQIWLIDEEVCMPIKMKYAVEEYTMGYHAYTLPCQSGTDWQRGMGTRVPKRKI